MPPVSTGATGIALSFCDQTEGVFLRDIERLTGTPLIVAGGTPFNGQKPGNSGRQGERQPQQQRRQPNRGRRMRAAA